MAPLGSKTLLQDGEVIRHQLDHLRMKIDDPQQAEHPPSTAEFTCDTSSAETTADVPAGESQVSNHSEDIPNPEACSDLSFQ